ncbi:hypothetical protein EZV62_008948 [Acer yangbiense]|uniref:Leucine-rich repeat-containing N-terminal plant-type domain-containing protein n=1 Tax=Acer yangbiense TaxID=1000413 RepID=A0A5C7IEI2_9ROSI|nr:hypothetical protein EZV62_008948 [Acer yangbiense]
MGLLMWCYQLVCLQLLLLHSLSFANLCSHDQSSALLQFKQLFSFVNYDSYLCDDNEHSSYPKMKHWKEDMDCCSWEGVTCDRVTGDVIGLDLSCSWLYGSIPSNTSLFLLFRLQKLNLAFNFFNSSHIPSDFVTFPSLTHLNLSSSYFSGQVPFQISHLSRLISLDLGTSWPGDHLTLETLVMQRLVQNMTKLEQLILDNVNMSTVAPGYLINLSSSLVLLSLSDCELHGSIPENIFHLPKLQALNLPNNYNLKCDFPTVNWSSPLRYMDVSSTSSSGKLPDSFGNLKSLSYLNMENCSFIGSVPASIEGTLPPSLAFALLGVVFAAVWCLVNTYGCSKGNMGLGACLGVFKNAAAYFIGGLSLSLGTYSSFFAELKESILAIQIAASCGWNYIWLKKIL